MKDTWKADFCEPDTDMQAILNYQDKNQALFYMLVAWTKDSAFKIVKKFAATEDGRAAKLALQKDRNSKTTSAQRELRTCG